jgi:hypothetical protein
MRLEVAFSAAQIRRRSDSAFGEAERRFAMLDVLTRKVSVQRKKQKC